MRCFLTSNPLLEESRCINPANGLLDKLRHALPENSRMLFVCSDPDSYERTDSFAEFTKACFEKSDFRFGRFTVLDNRNSQHAAKLVAETDFIFLAGGHVPTQNNFLAKSNMRALLRTFDGTLLGFSAGSMNSAETVYAQPELAGEAIDPQYKRFLPGLGLTKLMLLPHYQAYKDEVLDGLRVYEDITYHDSMGRQFYALVDGSYVLCCDGHETLYGEAYLIENGQIRKISAEGDIIQL